MNNDELIKNWFGKHEISTTSIYILSLLLIENESKLFMNKDEYIDLYVDVVLKKIVQDEKITKDDQKFYRRQIRLNKSLLHNLKKMVIDLTNSPNLLQKDKWSSRNSLLETTNNCFPCKKRNK